MIKNCTPCPFCGCKKVYTQTVQYGYVAYCAECLAHGPFGITPSEAIDRWNRRAVIPYVQMVQSANAD